jgi:Cu2+-exporting ATPase
MDVPISIGVVLTATMSLYETATGGAHAYFDAAIGLLFFLLVGRYLDHRMRDVARSAATRLMSLSARSAMLIEADETTVHVPLAEIVPGHRVWVATGERIPVDGVVANGTSDVDRSLLTGEPEPEAVAPGGRVFAGTLNLTGPLTVTVTTGAGDTLLAEIVRLMEAAERSGSRHVRLADRVARIYAPAVHILALATLVGWLAAGAGWHMALTTAVAVLVITCPCALGLAVPVVQVVASGCLLGRGVMLKDGGALERLATVDLAAFDKTGTLTEGTPWLTGAPAANAEEWAIAAGLGAGSRHPLAQALAVAARDRGIAPAAIADLAEHPGAGMEGRVGETVVRLGRMDWIGARDDPGSPAPTLWLEVGDGAPIRFAFEDRLREDAAAAIAGLKAAGLKVVLLSGDRSAAVAAVAAEAGIAAWRASQRPADKAEALATLAHAGRRVLMVGDGINDAPALAGAFVSISPSNAADISQTAADIVFTGRRLAPVATALKVARAARRLILENFGLAIAYNLIAVPVAVTGYATPLVAAIAMSASSVIVTVNALRLPLVLRHSPAGVSSRSVAGHPTGAT